MTNVYLRHDICLLFLKHGYSSETIVSQNTTMAEFLCNLRKRNILCENQGILMETLCAVFFSFKEGVFIDSTLKK